MWRKCQIYSNQFFQFVLISITTQCRCECAFPWPLATATRPIVHCLGRRPRQCTMGRVAVASGQGNVTQRFDSNVIDCTICIVILTRTRNAHCTQYHALRYYYAHTTMNMYHVSVTRPSSVSGKIVYAHVFVINTAYNVPRYIYIYIYIYTIPERGPHTKLF